MRKRIDDAIANRIPAAKNGGALPNPILIASHVDPQTKLMMANPIQRRTRSTFILIMTLPPS